ncbi:SKP1 component [Macleaya cordata]|uniref:SKP1 component n=1 Tax=Macleaya cordata TaxID=56857 RepID=A0A200QBC8_MACCD|nr:SKP1 component [Macleaya cordata]
MSNDEKVTLETTDGATITVRKGAAKFSETIKMCMEAKDGSIVDDDKIKIPQVNGNVLKKAMEFCERFFDIPEIHDESVDKELADWCMEYFSVTTDALLELMEVS